MTLCGPQFLVKLCLWSAKPTNEHAIFYGLSFWYWSIYGWDFHIFSVSITVTRMHLDQPRKIESIMCVLSIVARGKRKTHQITYVMNIANDLFFSLSLLVLGVIQLWALSNNQSTLIFRTIFPILIILPFVIIRIERDSPHRKRKIATFTIQLHASINIEGIKNIDFNLSLLSCCYHELVHFAMQPEIYQP